MKRWFPALLLLLVLALTPLLVVQACGPFFFPDHFVYPLHPDHPQDYAAGKLGVLLSTYPRADLFVAWRYLNGGVLNQEEQKGYHPLSSEAETESESLADSSSQSITDYDFTPHAPEADQWLAARNRYAPVQPEIKTVKQSGTVYSGGVLLSGSYENCQPDAFRVAEKTLAERVRQWGAKSAELAEWIKGQDAVFSHCPNEHAYGMPQTAERPTVSDPATLPATANLLLRQDRAYQQAAALFYAGKHDAAIAAFRAIAADSASPWRGVARYMVARTLVRQAFLAPTDKPSTEHVDFDRARMVEAQAELEAMQREPQSGISAQAVEQLLHVVCYRTEPQKRLAEVAAALSRSKVDPEYAQDLIDLTIYLNNKLDELPLRADTSDYTFKVDRAPNDYTPLSAQQRAPGYEDAYQKAASERALGEMVDWAITVQSPAASAKQHALAEWKRANSLPWLIAALMKAAPSDAEAPALLSAAALVATSSPAYATVTYHRIRLLEEAGRMDEARKVLAESAPVIAALGSEGAANLYAGLSMRSAATLDAALAFAPRKVLLRSSEEHFAVRECLDVMKNPKRKYDCKPIVGNSELGEDAAFAMNSAMPLDSLATAAASQRLPGEQRQAIAMMTWTRAVLLQNASQAEKVFPLLPAKLQQQAGQGVGFHALMTLARNPGLRPYLDAGTQRARSYDFIESYRDNWWCRNWQSEWAGNERVGDAGVLGFLPAAERAQGEAETRKLTTLGSAGDVLVPRIVEYARAHPNDPDVPEALYLALRMYRYSCGEYAADTPVAAAHRKITRHALEEVGHLLRGRYAASVWTKKAAPYGDLTLPEPSH